jgi:dCTP deaminase
MILAKKHLIKAIRQKKIIAIEVDPKNIGSNSIDVTLGPELYEVLPNSNGVIDMLLPSKTRKVELCDGKWIIYPNRLYLGTTAEIIGSNRFVPVMHGRSTPARSGFSPIVSAGYGDIGFIGQWTLEITTQAHPMVIRPGDRIAQIEFQTCSSNKHLYSDKGGKSGTYAGQSGVRAGKEGNL